MKKITFEEFGIPDLIVGKLGHKDADNNDDAEYWVSQSRCYYLESEEMGFDLLYITGLPLERRGAAWQKKEDIVYWYEEKINDFLASSQSWNGLTAQDFLDTCEIYLVEHKNMK